MRALSVGLVGLFLSACGDDGVGKLTDAPPNPDGKEIDAPTSGPVKITITSGSTGVPGVRVLFQNADSSLVLSATTDANGAAVATMDAGGFVTAIDAFPRSFPTGAAPPSELQTFAGVKPGDELVLHEGNGATSIVNVRVNIPLDGAASTYRLHTPCGTFGLSSGGGSGSGSGSGAPGGSLTLFDCPATADFLVEGFDSEGLPVRTLFKANVALAEGAIIDLTADSYVSVTDATFMYTNVPQRFGVLNVSNTVQTTRGPIYEIFGSFDVSNGTGAFSSKAPALIAGTLSVTSTSFFDNRSIHNVVGWGAATNTYTLDAGAALLPAFTGSPRFDVATHTTSWTQAATGATPDLSVHTVDLFRPSTGQEWSWTIAAPFTNASVALPVLPADGSRFNAGAEDNISIFDFATAKVPGGYDAIREIVLAANQDDIIIGPTGQVSLQGFQGAQTKPTKTTATTATKTTKAVKATKPRFFHTHAPAAPKARL
ncbi:MAG: hypothetical protein KIT31_24655 [Deltaproteobacteria bacterium]|nr:hypothetical protein [Deltaproteobacteria bacterium]